MQNMEHRITATDLARRIGDVLGRVCYRGDRFLVERNGRPVARIIPVDSVPAATVGEAFAAWRAVADPDPEFADILEYVNSLDRPPENPWDS